jgi:hypothetical protein
MFEESMTLAEREAWISFKEVIDRIFRIIMFQDLK